MGGISAIKSCMTGPRAPCALDNFLGAGILVARAILISFPVRCGLAAVRAPLSLCSRVPALLLLSAGNACLQDSLSSLPMSMNVFSTGSYPRLMPQLANPAMLRAIYWKNLKRPLETPGPVFFWPQRWGSSVSFMPEQSRSWFWMKKACRPAQSLFCMPRNRP